MDIKCDNAFTTNSWMNVFTITNEADFHQNGKRIFGVWVSTDGYLRFIMNNADNDPVDPYHAGRHAYESLWDVACEYGWNNYQLESRKNAKNSTINYILSKDGKIIYRDSHSAQNFPMGNGLKVYVSNPNYEAASLFHVRDFYAEILEDFCDDEASCPDNSICESSNFTCTCTAGYSGACANVGCLDFTCDDIDECAENVNPCGQSICVNTVGSFLCTCQAGFFNNGTDCIDVNECDLDSTCPDFTICKNMPSTFECGCIAGYVDETCRGFDECDGFECMDEDECVFDVCGENMICSNSAGSYSCNCADGFELVGDGCEDINECVAESNPCPDFSSCNNAAPSFGCFCQDGFGDGFCIGYECASFTCPDADECVLGTHLCEEICINTDGHYTCACPVTMKQVGNYSCEVTVFDATDLSVKNDDELKALVETEFGLSTLKLRAAMKSLNDSQVVSEVIGEVSASTGNILENLLSPKGNDDAFMNRIGSSKIDLLMESSENIIGIRNSLTFLLNATNNKTPSSDFISFDEKRNIKFNFVSSRSDLVTPVIAEIKENAFIYSDDDLRLAKRILYSGDFDGQAQVTFDQVSEIKEKVILPSRLEIMRFDLKNKEDFFVFFESEENFHLEIFIDFWNQPVPKLMSFRYHEFLPVYRNTSEVSSTICDTKTCSGNAYGIHFDKKKIELCFTRERCSIFVAIRSLHFEKFVLKVRPFSRSCVSDNNEEWTDRSCSVKSDSTPENLKCSCEISTGDKLTSRNGEVNTLPDYYAVFVEELVTLSVKLFPIILSLFWTFLLIRSNNKERLAIKKNKLHPPANLSNFFVCGFYIVSFDSRFSFGRAPKMLKVVITFLDLLHHEQTIEFFLGSKTERLFANGQETHFLMQLPIMKIIKMTISTDFHSENECEYLPKNISFFKIEKIPEDNTTGFIDEICWHDQTVVFGKEAKISVLGSETVSSSESVEKRLRKTNEGFIDRFLDESHWLGPIFERRNSEVSNISRVLYAGASLLFAIFSSQQYFLHAASQFGKVINIHQLIFGPVLLSTLFYPLLILVVFMISIALFSKSLLLKISRLKKLENFISILIFMFMIFATSFIILKASSLTDNHFELWMTSVYFFALFEIVVAPLIVSSLNRKKEASRPRYLFRRNHPEFVTGKYETLESNRLNREEVRNLVYNSKHKSDFYLTLRRSITYFLISSSLYGLSTVILPSEKFFLDKNFRDKISITPGVTQLNVTAAWALLENEVTPLIHFGNLSSGEKASVKDRAFAQDGVSFRLGPASLTQHRDQCGFFTQNWRLQPKVNDRVLKKVLKSPLLSPYYSETRSRLSSDIFLQTPSRFSSSTCAFTAILGTSKASADFMTNYLRDAAWIDQNTKTLVFEQSFLNMNIEAFIQLRIVFEFVEGGAILPTLTLQQLKNVDLADSTFAACLATFTAMLFYQVFEIIQLVKSRQLSFLSIFKAAICAADISVFVLVVLRGAYLSQAIDYFLLDPKGAPRFAKVFLMQHHFIPLIAMSLFMHTLLLIHILSTLNAVQRKIESSLFL